MRHGRAALIVVSAAALGAMAIAGSASANAAERAPVASVAKKKCKKPGKGAKSSKRCRKGASRATFMATISGTERTNWTLNRTDSPCQGAGSEVVSFSTGAPQRLTASVEGGLLYLDFADYWGVPVTAKLQRSASWSQNSGCGTGPDDAQAVPCSGGATLPWALEFGLGRADSNLLVLRESRYRPWPYGEDYDPVPGCWVQDNPFPRLIWLDGNQHAFGAPLSTAELLNAKRKSITTSAHGVQTFEPSEIASSTVVDWTLTLERVGGRKK